MNRSIRKLLLVLNILVFSILLLLGIFTGSKLIGFISVGIFLPLMIYLAYTLRCKKCGRWPMRYWLFENSCPNCGEKLE